MKVLKGQRPTYKVEKLLGEGLTGKVYKALRLDPEYGSHQVVAVKVLKSKNQVSLLRNEFSRLEKIQSNHCVKLLGWENLQMGPALILEYLEGMNLFDLLHHGELSSGIVQEIIAQAQKGLRDLDAQGLFHGDLSLKNIYVTTRGQIKLIDFGCGAAEGVLLGNPLFMAPELKDSLCPNLKTDLFSLGMIEAYLRVPGAESLRPEEAVESSVLLCLDPRRRRFQAFRSTAKSRRALGFKVRGALSSFTENQTTRVFHRESESSTSKFQKFSVAAAVFIFLCLTPGWPETKINLSAKDTWVTLQSQRPQLKSSFGKSSIYIDRIRPGIYRWRWPNREGGGESRILFRAGEHLRLIGQGASFATDY